MGRKDSRDTLVVISNDGMGTADEALRQKLLRKYLKLLIVGEQLPGAIALYTNGVKLAVSASPVLDELRALEAAGVHIILCKTCLDSFGLLDQVSVGIVGGMGDIMAAQSVATKVITL